MEAKKPEAEKSNSSGGAVKVTEDLLKDVPELDNFERLMKVDKAFNMLEKKNGFAFAAVLFNIGIPMLSTSIDTACVRTHDGQVDMQFNPRFLDWLIHGEPQLESLQTLLAHESLHILFGHARRRGDRTAIMSDGAPVWNIACDVVINRILEKAGQFTSRLKKLKPATYDVLGIPAKIADETAEDVYFWMLDEAEKSGKLFKCAGTLDDLGEGSGDTAGDGKGKGKGKKDGGAGSRELDAIQHEMEARNQQLMDRVKSMMEEELAKDPRQLQSLASPNAGSQPCGELRPIVKASERYKLKWDEVLARRFASDFTEWAHENWLPSRKILSFYPDTILPSEHEEEEKKKFNVLLVFDASGSIDHTMLKTMRAVVEGSLPKDRMKLTAISFDTEFYEVKDLVDFTDIRGGGGTDFSVIEDYAQLMKKKDLGRYPDIVVVFTDGCASRIEPELPDRWVWILVPGGYSTDNDIKGIGDVLWIKDAPKHGVRI